MRMSEYHALQKYYIANIKFSLKIAPIELENIDNEFDPTNHPDFIKVKRYPNFISIYLKNQYDSYFNYVIWKKSKKLHTSSQHYPKTTCKHHFNQRSSSNL